MGIRLHYAKTYKVEYSISSAFNIQQAEIASILSDHECTVYRSDDSDYSEYFDVPREEIARMVKELKNSTARTECGIPVDDLICFFSDAVKNAEPEDSDIHFSWF